jgi:formylmethanofuran dehydrogenase subunit B
MALGSGLLRKINRIPTIVIGAKLNYPARTSVSFETARPGIESGGTVARADGVMLPLRPVISSDLPTDRQILDAIRQRLDRAQ